MKPIGLAVVPAVAVLAASCTLGPDYQRPVVPVPAVHRGAGETDSGSTSAGRDRAPAASATAGDDMTLADLRWSELFRDPVLTELITRALAQNFDLRIAAERVLQARERFGIARSRRLPEVGASAGVTTTRRSQAVGEAGVPDGVDPDATYGDAGFTFGWELDVWGRLRRLSESARAQYFATEEARRAVVTTLVADVTDTYLALRALDLERVIAERTRETAADGLRLTEVRRERGIATALDVRQAEQLVHIASARIAGIDRDIEQTENALSLLLGEAPASVPRGLELEAFTTPPTVRAGLPSDLLERRPDIRQAEQELVAANAEIGAAKAEFFPRISLTGLFGVQSSALSDLVSGGARVWTAGAGATVPLFTAGRTRATVRITEAVTRERVVSYQKAIYTALREVADALAGYRRTSLQRVEQERLVGALRASVDLSTSRYKGGIDSFLQVLDARRNLFEGELDLARLRRQELSSLVALYRALGGGWDPAP